MRLVAPNIASTGGNPSGLAGRGDWAAHGFLGLPDDHGRTIVFATWLYTNPGRAALMSAFPDDLLRTGQSASGQSDRKAD